MADQPFDLRKRQVIHRLAERMWEQHGHPGQLCEVGPRGLGFCALDTSQEPADNDPS